MLISCVCCVGSGLCNDLITCSEESYLVFVSYYVWSRSLGLIWAVAPWEKEKEFVGMWKDGLWPNLMYYVRNDWEEQCACTCIELLQFS